MECEEARNAAWLAEDGESLPGDATRHLADCPECRTVLTGRRRVIDAYRALGEMPPGAFLMERVLCASAMRPAAPVPWKWAAAAAAAFLAAVGWGAWRFQGPATAPVPDVAFAFDLPRASIEDRLEALEQDLVPTSATHTIDAWGIDDVRLRIEALEKSLDASQPERKDGGQGAVPGGNGAGCAC